MIYKTRWFKIQELVPQDTFNMYEEERLWLFFDSRLLAAADKLRDTFGRCVINAWASGGATQMRGWRPWEASVGASISQHKFGRALDASFEKATAEEIRFDMRTRPSRRCYQEIVAVEDEVSWLHFDVRNWAKPYGEIYIFKP